MKYQEMFGKIRKLAFDKEMLVCREGETELFVLRPSKLSKRFRNYDVKRNFQIWLREDTRVFRPNHLRIMIDLHLRVRSRPDLKRGLAQAFDNIFYGKDPEEEIRPILKEEFEHFLNPLRIIANLSQLFIIEQEYGYYKESKFDPPTLFYQGWLREAIDDIKEVDNVLMSIAKAQQHPLTKYTNLENKKDKNYTKNRKPLWWLGD